MRLTFFVLLGIAMVSSLIWFGAIDTDNQSEELRLTAPTTTTTTTTTTTAVTTTILSPIGTLPFIEIEGEVNLDYSSSISTVGLDTVTFGMTVKNAQKAAGTRFSPVTPRGECFLAIPDKGPKGITFWIAESTVERIDIDNELIRTRSGAGIGDTESLIYELFGEKIETKILPESSERLLIYVPSDSSDKNFRVVFKSDGRLITRLWSGRLPWVEMAEIC